MLILSGVSVYVLVAIVKKRLKLNHLSIYTILQILSVPLFEKTMFLQVFADPDYTLDISETSTQLELYSF